MKKVIPAILAISIIVGVSLLIAYWYKSIDTKENVASVIFKENSLENISLKDLTNEMQIVPKITLLKKDSPIVGDPLVRGGTKVRGGGGSGSLTPTFDDSNSENSGQFGTTQLNFDLTTADNPNRIIIVGSIVSASSDTITSVTYGGQALTLLETVSQVAAPLTVDLWYLKNPPTGSNTVTINLSPTQNIAAGASVYYNVNQTTPFGTQKESSESGASPISVNVTSAVGELVVDVSGSQANPGTPTSPQTLRFSDKTTSGTAWAVGSSEKAGATSVTMEWTYTNYGALIAVPLKPTVFFSPIVNFR